MLDKRIVSLIPPSYRRSLGFIYILMVLAMLMETFSIGLIVPVISLLTDPVLLQSDNVLTRWLPILASLSEAELLLYGLFSLVLVYFIKTAFLTYFYWQQNAFSYSLCMTLMEELYLGYLYAPWTFHIENNSAFLLRNIATEVNMFINNIVINGLKLASEVLVVFGIGMLLLIMEPFASITVILVVACLGLVYQKLTKARLIHWGEERVSAEGAKILQLQQGLGAVKEIKLLGQEPGFLAMFHPYNLKSAKSLQYKMFLQQLPRLFLEVIAICGMTLLVTILLLRGESTVNLLPLIGLFAAAVFRLMPSVNRIIDAVQNIQYGKKSVEVLDDQLRFVRNLSHQDQKSPLGFDTQLEFHEVSYKYPSAHKSVLRHLNLTVAKGEIVGLIGASGAGKTTLVDLLLGLLTPDSGHILCDGVDIQNNLRGWQGNLGYVQQNISLLDDSLLKNIAFGVFEGDIDMEKVNKAVSAAQLDALIASLPEGLATNIGERGVKLSGGQRQRIGIARALYGDPDILVLDEATSALDHETEELVMEAIYELGHSKTLIIIAHRLTTVARCDKVYRIDSGKLQLANPNELSFS